MDYIIIFIIILTIVLILFFNNCISLPVILYLPILGIIHIFSKKYNTISKKGGKHINKYNHNSSNALLSYIIKKDNKIGGNEFDDQIKQLEDENNKIIDIIFEYDSIKDNKEELKQFLNNFNKSNKYFMLKNNSKILINPILDPKILPKINKYYKDQWNKYILDNKLPNFNHSIGQKISNTTIFNKENIQNIVNDINIYIALNKSNNKFADYLEKYNDYDYYKEYYNQFRYETTDKQLSYLNNIKNDIKNLKNNDNLENKFYNNIINKYPTILDIKDAIKNNWIKKIIDDYINLYKNNINIIIEINNTIYSIFILYYYNINKILYLKTEQFKDKNIRQNVLNELKQKIDKIKNKDIVEENKRKFQKTLDIIKNIERNKKTIDISNEITNNDDTSEKIELYEEISKQEYEQIRILNLLKDYSNVCNQIKPIINDMIYIYFEFYKNKDFINTGFLSLSRIENKSIQHYTIINEYKNYIITELKQLEQNESKNLFKDFVSNNNLSLINTQLKYNIHSKDNKVSNINQKVSNFKYIFYSIIALLWFKLDKINDESYINIIIDQKTNLINLCSIFKQHINELETKRNNTTKEVSSISKKEEETHISAILNVVNIIKCNLITNELSSLQNNIQTKKEEYKKLYNIEYNEIETQTEDIVDDILIKKLEIFAQKSEYSADVNVSETIDQELYFDEKNSTGDTALPPTNLTEDTTLSQFQQSLQNTLNSSNLLNIELSENDKEKINNYTNNIDKINDYTNNIDKINDYTNNIDKINENNIDKINDYTNNIDKINDDILTMIKSTDTNFAENINNKDNTTWYNYFKLKNDNEILEDEILNNITTKEYNLFKNIYTTKFTFLPSFILKQNKPNQTPILYPNFLTITSTSYVTTDADKKYSLDGKLSDNLFALKQNKIIDSNKVAEFLKIVDICHKSNNFNEKININNNIENFKINNLNIYDYTSQYQILKYEYNHKYNKNLSDYKKKLLQDYNKDYIKDNNNINIMVSQIANMSLFNPLLDISKNINLINFKLYSLYLSNLERINVYKKIVPYEQYFNMEIDKLKREIKDLEDKLKSYKGNDILIEKINKECNLAKQALEDKIKELNDYKIDCEDKLKNNNELILYMNKLINKINNTNNNDTIELKTNIDKIIKKIEDNNKEVDDIIKLLEEKTINYDKIKSIVDNLKTDKQKILIITNNAIINILVSYIEKMKKCEEANKELKTSLEEQEKNVISLKKTNNILNTDKQELETKLSETDEEFKKTIKSYEDKLLKKSKLTIEFDKTSSQVNDLKDVLTQIDNEIEKNNKEIEDLTNTKSSLLKRIKTNEESYNSLVDEQTEYVDKLNKLESNIIELERKKKQDTKQFQVKVDEYNIESEKYTMFMNDNLKKIKSFEKLKQNLINIQTEIEAINQENINLESEYKSKEKELEEKTQIKKNLNSKIAQLGSEIFELNKLISSTDIELKTLQDKKNLTSSELEKKKTEIVKLKEDIQKITDELNGLNQQSNINATDTANNKNQTLDEKINRLTDLKDKLNTQIETRSLELKTSKDELERLGKDIDLKQTQINELENELKALEAESNKTTTEKIKIDKELEDTIRKQGTLSAKMKELNEDNTRLKEELNIRIESIKNNKNQIRSNNDIIDKINSTLNELQNDINSLINDPTKNEYKDIDNKLTEQIQQIKELLAKQDIYTTQYNEYKTKENNTISETKENIIDKQKELESLQSSLEDVNKSYKDQLKESLEEIKKSKIIQESLEAETEKYKIIQQDLISKENELKDIIAQNTIETDKLKNRQIELQSELEQIKQQNIDEKTKLDKNYQDNIDEKQNELILLNKKYEDELVLIQQKLQDENKQNQDGTIKYYEEEIEQVKQQNLLEQKTLNNKYKDEINKKQYEIKQIIDQNKIDRDILNKNHKDVLDNKQKELSQLHNKELTDIKELAKSELNDLKSNYKDNLDNINNTYKDNLAKLESDHNVKLENSLNKQFNDAQQEYKDSLNKIQSDFESKKDKYISLYQEEYDKVLKQHKSTIEKEEKEHEELLKKLQDEFETKKQQDFEKYQQEYNDTIEKQKNEFETKKQQYQQEYENTLKQLDDKYKIEILKIQTEYEEKQKIFNKEIVQKTSDYELELNKVLDQKKYEFDNINKNQIQQYQQELEDSTQKLFKKHKQEYDEKVKEYQQKLDEQFKQHKEEYDTLKLSEEQNDLNEIINTYIEIYNKSNEDLVVEFNKEIVNTDNYSKRNQELHDNLYMIHIRHIALINKLKELDSLKDTRLKELNKIIEKITLELDSSDLDEINNQDEIVKINKLNNLLDDLIKDRNRLKLENNTLHEDIDKLKLEQDQITKKHNLEIEQLNENIKKCETEIAKITNDFLNKNNNNSDEFNTQIGLLKQKIEDQNKMIKENEVKYKTEISQLQKQLENIQIMCNNETEQLKIDFNKKEDNYKQEIAKLNEEIIFNKKSESYLKKERDQNIIKFNKYKEDYESKLLYIEELEYNISKCNTDLKKCKQNNTLLENENNRLKLLENENNRLKLLENENNRLK